MPKAVTIYTTPTCAFCHAAKAWFDDHKISYDEKDVLSNMAFRKEMADKSHQMGVPVIDIDGEIIVGFDHARLESLLGE